MVARIRLAAIALVVAGVALGTLSDDGITSEPVRSGEFWILTGDFHVHAFPGDGGLPVWELRNEARRRGLDVIAITNHNHLAAQRLAKPFLRNGGFPIVISGQEVTARDYHISAVGVQRVINARESAAGAIAAIHEQNGAAIAAHPSRLFWAGFDTAAARMLDGAEICHPEKEVDQQSGREFALFYERVRMSNPKVAGIGSSDFHFQPPLGVCRTFVLARSPNAEGVIAALRTGHTVAYNDQGTLIGEPALVSLVEQHLDSVRARGQATGIAQRLSVVSVLLGLLLLIIAGRPAEAAAKS